MNRDAEITALHRRAASLLRLYRASGRRWRFPLMSLFANLWMARLLPWISPFLYLPAVAHLMDAVLETNAAVHDALWAAWLDPAGTPALREVVETVQGSKPLPEPQRQALFEATLRWEQHDVVEPRFTPVQARLPGWLRAGMIIMPMRLASGWVVYRNFLSPAARISATLKSYRRAGAIGWAVIEERAARAIRPR